MIDAERRGNRRCANKRQERGTEGGRERPTKTECGRQTKEGRGREGRFDGSAGKSLKRENKRGLDWTAREKERMEGSAGECSFLRYCRRILMRTNKLENRGMAKSRFCINCFIFLLLYFCGLAVLMLRAHLTSLSI